MKPTLTKKFIATQQWYRQGAAALPWFISPPWSTLVDLRAFGARLPVSFGGVVIWMKDGQVEMYWPTNMMQQVSGYYVSRQLRDGRFLPRLHANWKRTDWKTLQRSVHAVSAADLRKLTDWQLRRVFLRFVETYIATWAEGIFHDAFDFTGDALVKRIFATTKRRATANDVETLLKPGRPLSIHVEESELALLARNAAARPSLRSLVRRHAWSSIRTLEPQWYAAVIRHRNRYYWMYNDYAHVRDLPASIFLNRIRELVRHHASLRKALAVHATINRVAVRQRRIEQRIGLGVRQRRILELLRIVQAWRDERKAMNQQGSSAMQRFAREISRRGGLPIDLVRQSFWWEFDRLLKPTKNFRSRLRTRSRGALHVTTRAKGIPGITGKESRRAVKLMRQMINGEELRGRSAFPGTVRGVARLMLKQADFPKFKNGEILVAPNTRPEYVPIMKKAAAIVTEEGGITSHAAIVSRELKIPAVVGVQGVLDALKDGDRVEVDANHGVVKKLP